MPFNIRQITCRLKRNGEVISYAKNHFDSLLNVTEAGAQYRRTGSAALDLAYVAAGRFDAYFELGLKPWDIAAGELIVKEAGGTVVDARGGSESMENGHLKALFVKTLILLKSHNNTKPQVLHVCRF